MDSRGIYKSVEVDLRQYKKLKMFLHAESVQGQTPLPGEGTQDEYDKRLVAFIRIGTDYKDNYYQIEVPLKPSSIKLLLLLDTGESNFDNSEDKSINAS